MKRFNRVLLLALIVLCLGAASVPAHTGMYEDSPSKISDKLREALDALCDDDRVDVYIWLTGIDYDKIEEEVKRATGLSRESFEIQPDDFAFLADFMIEPESLRVKMEEYLESTEAERAEISSNADSYIITKREVSRREYNLLNKNFINRHLQNAEIIFQSQLSPMIIASISKADVYRLEGLGQIELLCLYIELQWENMSCLETSLPSIDALHTKDNMGLTGKGVTVGIIEPGIVPHDVPDLVNTEIVRLRNPSASETHASIVAAIMVGKRGLAPDAKLISGNSWYVADFEGLITGGANVINMSAGTQFANIEDRGRYNAGTMWYDYLVYHHNITFVNSCGNTPTMHITQPSMAYNIISVGNINHRGTADPSDDIMSDSTAYITRPELASKPDVVAPGNGMGLEGYTDHDRRNNNGTSFAAPHVSGMVAQIMQARPELKVRPDLVKAIVMASCNRKVPGETMGTISNMQGAGVINATYAARAGGYAGTLTESMNAYDIDITLHAGIPTNIVLSWFMRQSSSTANLSLALTDLDLEVRDSSGTLVASSRSRTNNAELVRFIPSNSGVYTVRVVRHTNNATAEKFGIAYSIQGDYQTNPNAGDVNGDGVINAADATMLRVYLADPSNPPVGFNSDNANVNGIGGIDFEDLVLLRRYLAATDPTTVRLR